MTQIPSELLVALDALLDEALELSDAARDEWLARLRQERPDHAVEVERLLAAEAGLDARAYMSARPAALAGADTPGLAGQRVGGWTLERPLGQGGMGTVWLARRSDGRFEGTAAIKLLRLALLDRVGAERFRREGSVLARLSHPHIAKLLDAGVTAEGQSYLVLEQVTGERIDRYCDTRRLSPDHRLRLFLDVLGAVAHAHANLIVHRDLKPSNILVTGDGEVKLLDFGIAKLLTGDGPEDATTLTDLGGLALTPEYAAPEQVTGGSITTATDVYALGVLLYLLLAGRHPTGDTGRSSAEHLRDIVDTDSRRLSADVTGAEARGSSRERLRRLYAGDLDNILAQALKKRPEERYATVGALAEDLRRYLAHEPVTARPDSLRYRAGKFVRRHRLPLGLAALTTLALAAGVAGTVTQAVRAGRAARAAAEERDFALRQLSRAGALNDLNLFVLAEAAPSGKPLTVNALMAQAESIVERGPDRGANRVELFVDLARQYQLQEEPAKARRLVERAYELARGLQDPTARSMAACALGLSLATDGELARAEALVQEGFAVLPEGARYLPDRLECLFIGSQVARERGEMDLAVRRMEAAESLHELQRYPVPSADLYLQSGLALTYQMAGRLTDATRAFERAGARYVELGRDRTESAGTLYNNWALMLGIAGQPRAAESLFRRAIEINRADTSLASVSPILLLNYARTLAELERLPEAASYADLAYTGARRAGDESTANSILRVRGTISTRLGELERAGQSFAELATRLRAYPPGHPAFMHFLVARAEYDLRRGDLRAAFAAADSAVALAEVVPGANQFLARIVSRRAEVELAMRNFTGAERDARRALAAVNALVGDTPSTDAGRAHLLAGEALEGQGRRTESRAAYATAGRQLRATLGDAHPATREALRRAGGGQAPTP
jgi:serine/threonine protein kinase/tetratricopeptide (TPR) repeat protein